MTLSVRDVPRQGHLDSLPRVLAVAASALGLYVWGALRSPYKYADPEFILHYFPTELQVAVLLLVATLAWFPARYLGWRAPSPVFSSGALPLLILLIAAAGAWFSVRSSLPANVGTDVHRSLRVLGTTVLVGINEEWLFRGVVMAALCRRLGLKRGALISTALFGTFHMMNVVAGEPLHLAVLQMCITTLMGAIFALAAIATTPGISRETTAACNDLSISSPRADFRDGAADAGTARSRPADASTADRSRASRRVIVMRQGKLSNRSKSITNSGATQDHSAVGTPPNQRSPCAYAAPVLCLAAVPRLKRPHV